MSVVVLSRDRLLARRRRSPPPRPTAPRTASSIACASSCKAGRTFVKKCLKVKLDVRMIESLIQVDTFITNLPDKIKKYLFALLLSLPPIFTAAAPVLCSLSLCVKFVV